MDDRFFPEALPLLVESLDDLYLRTTLRERRLDVRGLFLLVRDRFVLDRDRCRRRCCVICVQML